MTECILIKGCKQSLSVQSPSLMLVSWRVKSADRTDHLKTPARPGWMTSNEARGSSLLTSVSGCITTFPRSFAPGTNHILQLSIMSGKTTQKTQDLQTNQPIICNYHQKLRSNLTLVSNVDCLGGEGGGGSSSSGLMKVVLSSITVSCLHRILQ